MLARLVGDHVEEVVGLLLLSVQLRIARDAEDMRADDGRAGKEAVQVGDHDALERHEAVLPRQVLAAAQLVSVKCAPGLVTRH